MSTDDTPPGHDPLAPGSYRHWIEDRVRFADLDPLGHCNNAAIGVFFESSRVALFDDLKSILAPHVSLVVVRVEIDFRRELRYATPVRVGLRVLARGRTSLTFGGGLFDGDACAATARVVGVLFDTRARRPVELPDALREALARYS